MHPAMLLLTQEKAFKRAGRCSRRLDASLPYGHRTQRSGHAEEKGRLGGKADTCRETRKIAGRVRGVEEGLPRKDGSSQGRDEGKIFVMESTNKNFAI